MSRLDYLLKFQAAKKKKIQRFSPTNNAPFKRKIKQQPGLLNLNVNTTTNNKNNNNNNNLQNENDLNDEIEDFDDDNDVLNMLLSEPSIKEKKSKSKKSKSKKKKRRKNQRFSSDDDITMKNVSHKTS